MDRAEHVLPFFMIRNQIKNDIAEHVLHIFMLPKIMIETKSNKKLCCRTCSAQIYALCNG